MVPEILVFSKKTYELMSKDDQALLMKVAREAQLEQRKLWNEREVVSVKRSCRRPALSSTTSPTRSLSRTR